MSEIAVEREVLVRARRETVFSFFTDPERFASWFGTGSHVDARPGGALRVAFPGGAGAAGEVVEVDPPRRIVFTWGYEAEDSPLPVGASVVEIDLAVVAGGTRVALRHRVPSDELRRAHVAGWRHHLSHLAVLAADERRSALERAVAGWFELWQRDLDDRAARAREVLAPDVEVLDSLGVLAGVDDVVGHVENAHAHLPGVTWSRDGALLAVGDRASWDWRMTHDEHGVVARGRGVARVDLEGRLSEVVGLWADHPDEVARRVHGLAPVPPPGGDDDATTSP